MALHAFIVVEGVTFTCASPTSSLIFSNFTYRGGFVNDTFDVRFTVSLSSTRRNLIKKLRQKTDVGKKSKFIHTVDGNGGY